MMQGLLKRIERLEAKQNPLPWPMIVYIHDGETKEDARARCVREQGREPEFVVFVTYGAAAGPIQTR